MPRPSIIRADTLDLQNQNEPSAQDHSKQPQESSDLLESGRPAPHQQSTMHHAEQESKTDMNHAPTNGEENSDHHHQGDGVDICDEPDDMDSDSLQLEAQSSQYGGDMVGVSSEDGEFADEDDLMDDEFMDKISSSPSIDDEDIDFEFVYALHNFVATVEGQANAAKGDTMVLLDDSNSYWWLVRVVKDSSIGYLPAEHIETPTERLARLNKHRNIDLSATMLGDNPEKSKNPLKKAMRRRNAKTVAFSAPTYIEASDMAFSSDDELEDGEVDFYNSDDEETSREIEGDPQDNESKDIVVEPLKPKPKEPEEPEETESVQHSTEPDHHVDSEEPRPSGESTHSQSEDTVSKSRNGTVRNADSFLKDDTIETKKISLTPNILRDELNSTNTATDEIKEIPGAQEPNDKAVVVNDKGKEDKKRKDKKPGVLSGLFKRKDKKSKTANDEVEESEKSPVDNGPLSPESSLELLSPQRSQSPKSPWQQRPSSKHQQQQNIMSTMEKDIQQEPVAPTSATDDQDTAAKDSIRRVYSPTTNESSESAGAAKRSEDGGESISSPVSKTGAPQRIPDDEPNSIDSRTTPVEKASSETKISHQQSPFDRGPSSTERSVASPAERFQPKPVTEYQERDVESPIDVSLVGSSAPGLIMGSSSSISPVSPPMSPVEDTNDKSGDRTLISPGTSTENTTWSDASLRSYLDDGNDIRDLFIIVHDKSNVTPAGPDHPICGGLFKEESKRLREMASQLDKMLVDWMGGKARNQTQQK